MMLANNLSRPLQGSQFIPFRDEIIWMTCFDSLIKERVEEVDCITRCCAKGIIEILLWLNVPKYSTAADTGYAEKLSN